MDADTLKTKAAADVLLTAHPADLCALSPETVDNLICRLRYWTERAATARDEAGK